MPIVEFPEYTQSSIEIHLSKIFPLGLPKPSDDRLDNLKEKYGFSKIVFDSDRDLIAKDGRATVGKAAFQVREAFLLSSANKAVATCLGADTESVIMFLELFLQEAFDVPPVRFRQAIDYISYATTTRVRFSGPLERLFAPALRNIFDRWSDLGTKSLAAPFNPAQWPPRTSAVVHATQEYWEKYFGAGAPQKGFAVPATLTFVAYLPSRFFRMTKYELSFKAETFEDFLENNYYVGSALPHFAHMALLEEIDGAIAEDSPLQARK